MSAKCPKCGATGDAIWEDNFWSGCHKCGWMSNGSVCGGMPHINIVPDPNYSNDDEDEDDDWYGSNF